MSFADLNIGDAAEAGPDAGPAVTETTVVIVGAGPAGYETPQRHLSLPIDVPVRLLPRFLTLFLFSPFYHSPGQNPGSG